MPRQLPKLLSFTIAFLYTLFILGGGASAISETGLRSIIKYTPHYGDEPISGSADVCSGGSSSISGSSNKERVWSYLAGKGLTPVAIAGIMGNLHQENSAFDPATKQAYSTAAIPSSGDGVTGFGIAQWTSKDRQAKLFTKIDAAGLSKYYGAGYGNPDLNKEKISATDNDKLLQVELDFMWSDDTTPVNGLTSELNAKTTVEGDGGSAMFFHDAYERSGDNAAELQERVQSAIDILAELGSNSCGALGGVSSLEDGAAWAQKFIEAITTKFGARTAPLNGAEMSDGKSLYSVTDGTTCTFDTSMGCEQCTALSGWFVATMTDYTYGGGNGDAVVGNLAAKGVPTGNTPKPFSVFSIPASVLGNGAGHTGIVLGVLEDGQVITLDNNWPGGKLSVRKYNITEKYRGTTFAYVGNKMKDSSLSN